MQFRLMSRHMRPSQPFLNHQPSSGPAVGCQSSVAEGVCVHSPPPPQTGGITPRGWGQGVVDNDAT